MQYNDRYARGRRIRESDDAVGQIYKLRVPGVMNPRPQNRRNQIQGGGSTPYAAKLYQRHPFLTGFGGTLIALKLIHGERTTS